MTACPCWPFSKRKVLKEDDMLYPEQILCFFRSIQCEGSAKYQVLTVLSILQCQHFLSETTENLPSTSGISRATEYTGFGSLHSKVTEYTHMMTRIYSENTGTASAL